MKLKHFGLGLSPLVLLALQNERVQDVLIEAGKKATKKAQELWAARNPLKIDEAKSHKPDSGSNA